MCRHCCFFTQTKSSSLRAVISMLHASHTAMHTKQQKQGLTCITACCMHETLQHSQTNSQRMHQFSISQCFCKSFTLYTACRYIVAWDLHRCQQLTSWQGVPRGPLRPRPRAGLLPAALPFLAMVQPNSSLLPSLRARARLFPTALLAPARRPLSFPPLLRHRAAWGMCHLRPLLGGAALLPLQP